MSQSLPFVFLGDERFDLSTNLLRAYFGYEKKSIQIQKVPPIILRDKTKFTVLAKHLETRRINYGNARATEDGVQMNPQSAEDHRKILEHLKKQKITHSVILYRHNSCTTIAESRHQFILAAAATARRARWPPAFFLFQCLHSALYLVMRPYLNLV